MKYFDGFEGGLDSSVQTTARHRMTTFIVEHNITRKHGAVTPIDDYFRSALRLQQNFNLKQEQPYPDDWSESLLICDATRLARHVLEHDQKAFAENPLIRPVVFDELSLITQFMVREAYGVVWTERTAS